MTDYPADRTAIVTGVASERGIGRTTAELLASRGWHLGLIDLDGERTAELASDLADRYGVKAAGVGVDVSQEEAVHAAIDQLEAQLPQVVGLANIAGVSSPDPYLEVTSQEWHRVIDVNLHGVHYVTQKVARGMADRSVGRIVSISSVSAQRGGGTYSKTAYSTAKAGLIGFTRSLARELGPHHITVNAIAPGPVDTDIMGGTLTDERKAGMVSDLVLDRIGTPADIAHAIAFLFSEEASFITGQTLNVDGGHYMH